MSVITKFRDSVRMSLKRAHDCQNRGNVEKKLILKESEDLLVLLFEEALEAILASPRTPSAPVLDVLQRIERDLHTLHGKVDTFMATTKEQFDNLVAAFNSETNVLATKLDSLKQQLADALKNPGSLTQAEEDALFAQLTQVSTRLQALGADSTNPVPPADENPPVPGTVG